MEGVEGWNRVQTAGSWAAEECAALWSWRGAVGELLNQDCVSVALLLSGRRAGQSRAHPLAGAMERPWAGAETGAGRVVLVLRR